MSYRILPTRKFEKELKRLAKKFPSLRSEFSELITTIQQKPESGTNIGNNCYKIRLAITSKGKGKSGGARVITCLYILTKTVYLLTIYDKSEKNDLKPGELSILIENLEFE